VIASVAAAIEVPLPAGAGEDSFSFLREAQGRPATKGRSAVINHSVSGMFAIRRGPWKLVLGNGSGGREQPKGKSFDKPYHHYNLVDDPGETRNLIDEMPAMAADLEKEFEQIRGGAL
jgi:hypothetical protein